MEFYELDTNGEKNITDVEFSWDFSSSAHFIRVFRKYFGVVPSSFLKAHRSSGPGIRDGATQGAASDSR